MTMMMKRLMAVLLAAVCSVASAQAPSQLAIKPALKVGYAASAAILGSAQAGSRLVAVGDHGVVLLSDDQGAHWRQAQTVPVRSMLTAVSFADAKRGWAVGHWGVVLATSDGGETWALQRSDLETDRPLFSVQALDAEHVVAVGLWSLVLTSSDAGKNWQEQALDVPAGAKRADLNLFSLFTDAQGRLFAAAERGMLLRSDDRGQHWTYLASGYKGSFWTGASPAPGVLIAAGLRGSIYRSADDGKTWHRIESGSTASITAALLLKGEGVELLGLDGLRLQSHDRGETFTAASRKDRAELTTGLALADGRELLFSRSGVVRD